MFRIVGHTEEIKSRFLMDAYYKLNVEWGEPYSANHVYWQLSTDKTMLMLGMDRESGALASVATPLAQFDYQADKTFQFSADSIYRGIPIFDVSRFLQEGRCARNDNKIITEAIPFSLVEGANQILVDFVETSKIISCVSSERADFYMDQQGFVTKILFNMTVDEVAVWKSYHLQ